MLNALYKHPSMKYIVYAKVAGKFYPYSAKQAKRAYRRYSATGFAHSFGKTHMDTSEMIPLSPAEYAEIICD